MNTNITSGLLSFIARIGKTDNVAQAKNIPTFNLLQQQSRESPSAHTDRLMRIAIMLEINYLVSQLNSLSSTITSVQGKATDKTMLTILILQLRLEMMKLTLRLKASS